ncbi:MAG: CBS domain-containing protein [Chitinophagales bacterium]
MIAKYAIEESVPYLKISDTVEFSLELMEDYKLEHLPIVEDKKLVGIIAEKQLLECDFEQKLGTIDFPFLKTAVQEYTHVFDVMKLGYESSSSILPVIDKDEAYLGMITPKSLLNFISQHIISNEEGGIFVVKIEKIQYSLAEISRLVEANKASIITTTTIPIDIDTIQVTVKVDVTDLTYILATLERYGYNISNVFHKAEQIDELKERYDALMHYLNV